MKRILIVGAGFLQSFVIKKARDLGYYTIAIDKNPNSVGFQYADEYAAVDIVDPEVCLRFAETKKLDGVITAASDYGVLSTSYIAEKLNLPGLEYGVAKLIKNKYEVRKKLQENNIDGITQFYEISNIKQINTISYKIKFPVMVKPCDGSGSKAAKRVDNLFELKDACKKAISNSLVGKALIEDFIEGNEYGVESFVHNGQINVLGIMAKQMTAPPNYAELGHSYPGFLGIEEKVEEKVKKAISALGINFGAVNMDFLVTNDNRIYIIDIGARMGGNLIGSHIIPIGTGLDYISILLKSAVGDQVEIINNKNTRNIVTRLLALEPGKVINMPNVSEIESKYNVKIYHQLKIGKVINEYRTNLDGLGYVVSVSDDMSLAKENAELAKKAIDQNIVRDTIEVL